MDKWHSLYVNTHYKHGYSVLRLIWPKRGLSEFSKKKNQTNKQNKTKQKKKKTSSIIKSTHNIIIFHDSLFHILIRPSSLQRLILLYQCLILTLWVTNQYHTNQVRDSCILSIRHTLVHPSCKNKLNFIFLVLLWWLQKRQVFSHHVYLKNKRWDFLFCSSSVVS